MFTLYLITDGGAAADTLRVVEAALRGAPPGRVCVQLRAKQQPAADQLSLAHALRAICHASGAKLLVNDRVDVALAVAADGVHVPERGLPLSAARQLLGPSALIGVSCHDARGLESAARGGADFATLSPVFASPGKGEPLGVTRFAAFTAASALPVYALGGVTAQHGPQLRAAGAHGLAAISAISAAPEPAAAVRSFLQSWDGFPS